MFEQPIKLVYILPNYEGEMGNHFYHKLEFVRRLRETGHNIFLILERGEWPLGLEHVYIQKFTWIPFRALELVCVLFALRLKGYKIFWTHYSFFGGIFAPWFGKSFYWNCGMPWLYERPSFEEKIFQRALRSSRLVTGTEGMKDLYVKEYNLDSDRIFVLPNWINLERFRADEHEKKRAREALHFPVDAKIVLFIHHLSPRKGADYIMPVAREFESDPDVIFAVAGSGPLQEELMGRNIRLLGPVAQTKVPELLAASDVLFMPSEEEGFPHVALEAMAVGVPIVSSNVGGVHEIISPSMSEYIVERDPQQFIEKIKILLKNPELATRLGDEERIWVEKYGLERVREKFLELIQNAQ